MHYTLTPRINAALIAIEVALVLGCYLTDDSPSLAVWAGFAVAGVLAGILQGAALRGNVHELKTATSARQIRAALIASLPGKAAIVLLWAVAMTVAAVFFYGGKSVTVPAMVGFYAIFALGREVAAFPALFVLRPE